ncbi:MAG: hypothetical protein K2H46_02720 [Muribaculaceae bacterium]|nr:hypothetical protein [Muribaculaceae bacterium]
MSRIAIPTHIHKILISGFNIRQRGIARGRSIMKHCALCHGQSLTALDNFQQSHTEGREVNVSNPSTTDHWSESHASSGLRRSSRAV